MPSIDSYDLIKRIIDNNGHYEDDPIPLQISQYINFAGGTTYHIAYSLDDIEALYMSPFCKDIKILWKSGQDNER